MKSIKKLLGLLACVGMLGFVPPLYAENAPADKTVVAAVVDKVNVNTATAAELERVLVGIGAKKAEAIVQYREKNGAFSAPEQLLEVQGFGKATLEKNRERLLF